MDIKKIDINPRDIKVSARYVYDYVTIGKNYIL
jgi:hypothetical protein